MQCNDCGQHDDWLGDDTDWEPVTGSVAVRELYECTVCGHRQRNR